MLCSYLFTNLSPMLRILTPIVSSLWFPVVEFIGRAQVRCFASAGKAAKGITNCVVGLEVCVSDV